MKRTMRWMQQAAVVGCFLLAAVTTHAQDRFRTLPGYENYQKVNANYSNLARGGEVRDIKWHIDKGYVEFDAGDDTLRFDLAARSVSPAPDEVVDEEDNGNRRGGSNRARPGRGRQRDKEPSPDEKWTAVSQGWNVHLEGADDQRVDVTTAGHRKLRYGTASWVYGEELDQQDAMWWSPDSSMLAFYEFDESNVKDFYLLGDLNEVRSEILTEGYPKPGEPNPVARLMIYHLSDKSTTTIDVGSDTEQYVFNVRWTEAGDELLYFRTNRHQNKLELLAANPQTGSSRVILTETQDTWQKNRPTLQFLNDGKRFIWETEKRGVSQFELRDLSGELIATLTPEDFDATAIEEVDEDAGVLYYMARSDANPLATHLHRVSLDGTHEKRLTQEPMRHRVEIAPDHSHFITTYESAIDPPASAIYTIDGERLGTLCESDLSRFNTLDLQMPELFTFTASDGETELFGLLFKPSHFDFNKKYPLIVDVYGGPYFQTIRNTFRPAYAQCEFGCLIAIIENRGTVGRGKKFESATYLQLGTVDIADLAEGVKFLDTLPFVDSNRVGIFGHSYGGFMSAMAVLRYPELFHVAVAGSAVTDWHNYDTIYTERYMRTPDENPSGYVAGSCMTYVDQFRGRLLVMHGMVDDNVHPNNVWQLVDAMQQKNKRIDMVFYPTRGHGLGRNASSIQWEYLYDHLIAVDVAEGARQEKAISPDGDDEP